MLNPRVCILGYFYFGQDQRLRDESAAVAEHTSWGWFNYCHKGVFFRCHAEILEAKKP